MHENHPKDDNKMSPRRILNRIALFFALFLAACGGLPSPATAPANLPNPAAVFCEQNGGKVDLRTDASGGVAGVCVFEDGSECDEWAFYRGECKPGTPPVSLEGWKVYENTDFHYTFEYPPDAVIQPADDPLHGLSIVGPARKSDNWPMISISHPQERTDFFVPPGTDLESWLKEKNLAPVDNLDLTREHRMDDTQIAGQPAIHLRFERSQQSYAYDKYFFVKSNQLYMIVILHTADYEDWDVYNQFLESFSFTGTP